MATSHPGSTGGSGRRVPIPGACAGGGAVQAAPGEEREACTIQRGCWDVILGLHLPGGIEISVCRSSCSTT